MNRGCILIDIMIRYFHIFSKYVNGILWFKNSNRFANNYARHDTYTYINISVHQHSAWLVHELPTSNYRVNVHVNELFSYSSIAWGRVWFFLIVFRGIGLPQTVLFTYIVAFSGLMRGKDASIDKLPERSSAKMRLWLFFLKLIHCLPTLRISINPLNTFPPYFSQS